MKLESKVFIWRLSGKVDSLAMKPNAMTSDQKGNVFVGDETNNRILKINSMTGEVMSILLLEEKNAICSLLWSDTEPNLIVIRGDGISFYNIPTLLANSDNAKNTLCTL